MPPVVRLLPLLLLALLALSVPTTAAAAAQPPAAAHQSPWDDGDWGDGGWSDWVDTDGDGWADTPAGQAPATPTTPVPAPTAAPSPSPAPAVPAPAPAPARPALPDLTLPLVTTATVKGRVAMLRRGGKAAIPRGAPLRVRRVIAAANRIVGKPYKWGGGHARLEDRGYDCSGSVGYALIRSGLLGYPMVSGTFARWGRGGTGKWITIYANKGHVYMEVAGLRLDTSPVMDPRGGSGPRWRPLIGKRQGFHVRHIAGL